MTSFLFLWLFFYSLGYFAIKPEVALFLDKIGYSAVILISSTTYLFSLAWSKELYEKSKRIALFFFALFGFFSILNLKTDLIVAGIKMHFYGFYPFFNKLGIIALVLWLIPMSMCFINFFVLFRNEKSVMKKEIGIMLLGILIGYTASVDFIPAIVPNIRIYPIGYLSIYLFAIFLGRAVVSHQIMIGENKSSG